MLDLVYLLFDSRECWITRLFLLKTPHQGGDIGSVINLGIDVNFSQAVVNDISSLTNDLLDVVGSLPQLEKIMLRNIYDDDIRDIPEFFARVCRASRDAGSMISRPAQVVVIIGSLYFYVAKLAVSQAAKAIKPNGPAQKVADAVLGNDHQHHELRVFQNGLEDFFSNAHFSDENFKKHIINRPKLLDMFFLLLKATREVLQQRKCAAHSHHPHLAAVEGGLCPAPQSHHGNSVHNTVRFSSVKHEAPLIFSLYRSV